MGCGGSKVEQTDPEEQPVVEDDPGQPHKKKKKEHWDLQVLNHNMEEGDCLDAKCGINCMALSEDQSMLATGSDDRSIKVWSVKTIRTECIANLQGHTDYINVVLFESGHVISASADKTIRKWDVLNRECVLIYDGHTSVVNRMLCTGDLLFSTSYDKTCRCWDVQSGACLRVYSGHKRGVYPVIFIPDFIPVADDEDVASTNKNFSIHGNRDLLITGSADFSCRVWSYESGRVVNTMLGHNGAITCMTVDATAKTLYSGATDYTVRSWNIIRGNQLKVFEGHTGSIVCMTIRNKILYTGSSDYTARAWVCEFAECTRIYKEHKHSVGALKVANGMVYTACGDGVARIFDAKGGALKRSFEGHQRSVTCLQIANMDVEEPEDELDDPKPNVYTDDLEEKVVYVKLFTGSYDGTLRTWDAGGIVDETVFSKDDEEKKKKEKELAKRKKEKKKEELKAAKRQMKLEQKLAKKQAMEELKKAEERRAKREAAKAAQAQKIDMGAQKILIEDEGYALQTQETQNGYPQMQDYGQTDINQNGAYDDEDYDYGNFDGYNDYLGEALGDYGAEQAEQKPKVSMYGQVFAEEDNYINEI